MKKYVRDMKKYVGDMKKYVESMKKYVKNMKKWEKYEEITQNLHPSPGKLGISPSPTAHV